MYSTYQPHLGFPDKGYFGHVSKWTQTPLRAIWLATIFSILPGFLDFASPVAANAVFSLTAMALDISYIIPIALRRIFQHHPEVQFTPGPFYLGDGLLGWAVNLNCIVWTLFVSVIFSLPTYLPVTRNTMNYASVITGSVVLLAMYAVLLFGSGVLLSCIESQDLVLSGVCRTLRTGDKGALTPLPFCSGRRHYRGPHTYVKDDITPANSEGDGEKVFVGGKGEREVMS